MSAKKECLLPASERHRDLPSAIILFSLLVLTGCTLTDGPGPSADTLRADAREAILAGDFLHARSMFLVGTLGGKRCLDLICRATGAMVAGEFFQLSNVDNLNQSEKDYFSVINGSLKTKTR